MLCSVLCPLCLGLFLALLTFLYKRFCVRKPKLESLDGRTVLITGASSGLGEALAHACHQRGASLILAARSKEKLTAIAEQLSSFGRPGQQVSVEHLDLADPGSIDGFVARLQGQSISIDMLINNAGMSYRGTIRDTHMPVHRQLMEVNYLGHVALTTGLLPLICPGP